jgi:hypothetical protein
MMIAAGFAIAATVLVGLLAGVHLTGIAALNRALRALPASTYIQVKQSMDRELPRLAAPLTISSLAAMLGAAITAALAGCTAAAIVAGFGTVAGLVALLAVLRGDLPINKQMDTWDPATPPADWQVLRHRWERFFQVRAIAVLTAFGCLVAAGALLR